jgi:hypothetical protein
MERLGDTVEFGEILLRMLELANQETGRPGWTIHRRRGFAGDGVLLIATHPDGYDVSAAGATVAEAAIPLFLECVQRITVPAEGQLELPV